MVRLNATCVAIGRRGLLLFGPSGAGKSDLALRLIDDGARLVADDWTEVRRVGARLVARAPAAIAGMLEVRGLGIVQLPAEAGVRVVAAIALGGRPAERLPRPGAIEVLGLDLPQFRIAARDASAAAKARLAVRIAAGDIGLVR